MPNNKITGDLGERDVVDKVCCPNCQKNLMLLPPNFPLVDIQCTACNFRAQIKTINSEPKDVVFGAGWEIMNKVLKSGYMVPQTFLNFKWKNHQEIRFYPFIPRINLKNYVLSKKARRANYKMFHYIGMSKLPYFVVYKK